MDELKAFADCPACIESSSCYLENDVFLDPHPGKLVDCDAFWAAPADERFHAWAVCAGFNCPDACGFGSTTECANNYSYPVYPGRSTVDVEVWVSDNFAFADDRGYADAVVVACEGRKPECTPVAEPAATTDEGFADIVDLPIGGMGFSGYFEMTLSDGTQGLFVPAQPITKDTRLYAPVGRAEQSSDGTGSIFVIPLTCSGANLRLGQITADAGTVTYRNPNLTWADIVDVPSGMVEVIARQSGKTVAKTTVPVRANLATSVLMFPTSSLQVH